MRCSWDQPGLRHPGTPLGSWSLREPLGRRALLRPGLSLTKVPLPLVCRPRAAACSHVSADPIRGSGFPLTGKRGWDGVAVTNLAVPLRPQGAEPPTQGLGGGPRGAGRYAASYPEGDSWKGGRSRVSCVMHDVSCPLRTTWDSSPLTPRPPGTSLPVHSAPQALKRHLPPQLRIPRRSPWMRQ